MCGVIENGEDNSLLVFASKVGTDEGCVWTW